MTTKEIIELVSLIITTCGFLISIITSLIKGELKKFIIEKMEEAEQSKKTGIEKLNYVIEAVKSKYKIVTIIINIENFIEKVIEISKKINYKKD